MDSPRHSHHMGLLAVSIAVLRLALAPASAQSGSPDKAPWMNAGLSPDERAAIVV
jgi:hypothetical protein